LSVWRVLDTGLLSAAENMALDEVLLISKAKGLSPNTLRFLRFKPCVLLGYHQSLEQEVRVEYCAKNGIEINRRITGGGSLYWDEPQLGWEIYADKAHPAIPFKIDDLYKKLSEAVVEALRDFGVDAKFRPRNDIEVNHRKICGTGGTELDGAFMFQGSLLIDFDVETMLRALRIPTEKLKNKELKSVKERVTCLKWELGYVPPLSILKEKIVASFARKLGVEFEKGGLLPYEKKLLAEKLPKFKSESWINKIKKHSAQRQELQNIYKRDGGLIRISLVMDALAERIDSVLITGDFFCYPSNGLFDLENQLKLAKATYQNIERIVKSFFANHKVQVPGLSPQDFVQAIWGAVKKGELAKQGLEVKDCNHVFTVGGSFDSIEGPQVLLLPYCAKKTKCKLRYCEGCTECGGCSVGEGFKLAREYGLIPITIQNYEMLEETLLDLKAKGYKSFIGCCCEAFYAKHQEDFERIALPGILIDIDDSTCYELGEEEQAHLGSFENQTELKMDLLERILALKCSFGGKVVGSRSHVAL
jgi:lipoate-protein ligase A